MNETVSPNEPERPRFSDALLDLDESEFEASAIADDVVLDLDLETPSTAGYQGRSYEPAPAQAPEPVDVQAYDLAEEPAPAPEPFDEPIAVSEAQSSDAENAPTGPLVEPPADVMTHAELSPEVINAIARRVIEQMSDKVVREIAWEVVPDLSELMIRKKLDQK
jgi:hypothetical protein